MTSKIGQTREPGVSYGKRCFFVLITLLTITVLIQQTNLSKFSVRISIEAPATVGGVTDDVQAPVPHSSSSPPAATVTASQAAAAPRRSNASMPCDGWCLEKDICKEGPEHLEKQWTSQETLSRISVAKLIRQESRPGCSLFSYETFVGNTASDPNEARKDCGSAYLNALTRSKIVVTGNPGPYDGDSRTMEALASGALVLVDHMLDAPPTLKDGVNVVYYKSHKEMLEKLLYYLKHVDEADKIVAEGLKAVIPPAILIDNMLDIILKGRSSTGRTRIYYEEPRRFELTEGGEWKAVYDGLHANPRVEVVSSPAASEFIFFDIWSLFNDHPARMDELIGNFSLTESTIIALDWQDSAHPFYKNDKFAMTFKRSRITSHKWYDYPKDYITQHLTYPLKTGCAEGFKEKLSTSLPRRERPVDVSALFDIPYWACWEMSRCPERDHHMDHVHHANMPDLA